MKSAVEFLLEKYKSQNTLLFADDWEQAKSIEIEHEEKILISDKVIEEMSENFSDKHFVYETAKDDVYFGFSEGMKSYREFLIGEKYKSQQIKINSEGSCTTFILHCRYVCSFNPCKCNGDWNLCPFKPNNNEKI
jgi:hypothetical protein